MQLLSSGRPPSSMSGGGYYDVQDFLVEHQASLHALAVYNSSY